MLQQSFDRERYRRHGEIHHPLSARSSLDRILWRAKCISVLCFCNIISSAPTHTDKHTGRLARSRTLVPKMVANLGSLALQRQPQKQFPFLGILRKVLQCILCFAETRQKFRRKYSLTWPQFCRHHSRGFRVRCVAQHRLMGHKA